MMPGRSASLTMTVGGLMAGLLVIGLLALTSTAGALPPAGGESLNVTAEVGISSRLGEETITLTGIASIERDDPQIDGGVEVAAARIAALSLTGDSVTGPITVTVSETLESTGELRSLQPPPDQFPASSFFDAFLDAAIPVSGIRSAPVVHNEMPLHLVPMENGEEVSLSGWPPVGVTYAATPDPCVPLLPELPAEICITSVSIEFGAVKTPTPTFTPCPTESCAPSPTSTPTHTPCPPTVCVPTPTPTPTPPPPPEDPTFSTARGGPSGLHPADLLGVGQVVLNPTGNDNFANAWQITSFPFRGEQNTALATTEPGEELRPPGCILGATVWFTFTPSVSNIMTADTEGSDSLFDTVLVLYQGTELSSLAVLGCDDDGGTGLLSEKHIPVTAGTTYYLQVGGFGTPGDFGNLVLNVSLEDAAAAGQGLAGHISCSSLGLAADGCDDGSDGDQDDIDALSFGLDFASGSGFTDTDAALAFSVAPGSTGLPGSAVAGQAACSPSQPQADEFSSPLDGTNAIVFDGDGQDGGCPSGPALGLTELPSSDDLNALNELPPEIIDQNGDGQLDDAVFFSLAAGSPSLAIFGRSAADIMWTIGFQPGLYASAADLGLLPGDDIDAMCLRDTGPGPLYDSDIDTILFSLAAGSPSLAEIGARASDLLGPGPEVEIQGGRLGLRVSDDLNAAKCFQDADPTRESIAVGDIWFCGSSFQGGVCETKIDIGDTVIWDFEGSELPHTVTECGDSCDDPTSSPLFDSGAVTNGGTFAFVFDEPGTYRYYCSIHPTLQRGVIIVSPDGLIGDVNCDGTVNPIDSALILQLVSGLLDELSCSENSDTNADGSTNAIDAALVLQLSAGLLDELPP
ncbi:MAG: hypothetical protein IH866_03890 [Chloroflexi bacterium]|nr:hypothetical protein [Chloroflexota bacterium]